MPRVKDKPLRGSVTQNFAYNRRQDPAAGRRFLIRLVLLIAGLGVVAGGVTWALYKKWPETVGSAVQKTATDLTLDANFTIRDVAVLGRRYTDRAELKEAVGARTGDPILAFDPNEALKRVEALPWVAEASVQRRLPNIIYVKLTEREPAARWQRGGKTVVIDQTGRELPQVKLEDFAALPLVIGEDAPRETQALLLALKPYPALAPLLISAVRVAERRWNLYLRPRVLVKLPEKDLEGALRKLTQLVLEQKILERDVVAIDLRLPDRLYLESGARPSSKD